MQVLDEAIRATHNRYAGIKRYTKADFDKWFAEYDVCLKRKFEVCRSPFLSNTHSISN